MPLEKTPIKKLKTSEHEQSVNVTLNKEEFVI